MRVILRCPLCREKFKYDVADGFPDDCQICHKRIAHDRADDDVVMPAFLSPKTKANDKVARDIMDGSETRAQMAAEMAGTPVSEMSGLKITDLNDRNDTQFAAKEVVNPVTQQMDVIRANGGQVGFGATEAQAFAAAAHTGSDAYAGAKARSTLQRAMAPIGQAPLPLELRK